MSKADREIVAWITRGGKHIPIFKHGGIASNADKRRAQILKARQDAKIKNLREQRNFQQYHKSSIQELNKSKYGEGTYDIDTKKTLEFDTGYQVTFWQKGDDYTDAEYEGLTLMMSGKSSDGKVYAGKFGGSPEISWHFSSRKEAVAIGRKYNQQSVLDWKALDNYNKYEKAHPEDAETLAQLWLKVFIDTGGTGERKKK